MKFKNLSLFYFPECPYCYVVIKKINELNLCIEIFNINEISEKREFLFTKTGRYTVPCLFINESPMHESAQIVEWLETHQDELKRNS